MLDSLVQSIENTFTQFSFRRLLYILFLLVLVISSLYIFNESTGYTLYTRIDKRLSALERLHQLEKENIQQSPDLAPIYQSIIDGLNQPPPQLPTLSFTRDPIIKFLGATLVPVIYLLIVIFQIMAGKPPGAKPIGGALFIALFLGIPAVLIPTWRTPWINAAIYFVVQMIIIILLMKNADTPQNAS